jgi:hypothetical protein
MIEELQAIRADLAGATLSAEVRQAALVAFDHLPGLYQQLERTSESRFCDLIRQRVQHVLRILAQGKGSPDATHVAEELVARLRTMHDQFGIPSLGLKAPAPPKPVRKRKPA